MMEFDTDKLPKNVLECLLIDKNSPKMFAERMKYHQDYLLKNPDYYTPSYKKRYETFIEKSQSLQPLEPMQ